MISVEVRYKLVGSADWRQLNIEPSDYFWRAPEGPLSDWDVDDVPKHNHIEELLALKDSDRLERAVNSVKNSRTGDSFACAYQFWGGHQDYVCLVSRRRQGSLEQELIFSGNVPFKENGSQVVRVSLDSSGPKLTMNCFMWGPGLDDHSLNMLAPDEANNSLKSDAAKPRTLG